MLVTGAASGIGRALSAAFAAAGARVFMSDLDRTALGEAANGIAGVNDTVPTPARPSPATSCAPCDATGRCS